MDKRIKAWIVLAVVVWACAGYALHNPKSKDVVIENARVGASS